jgi:acyl-CoA thioester hydrolase
VTPPAAVAVAHIRVRYKDTDTMQVVYYGNYLTYFEVARVEFLRQHDRPISEVNRKLYLPVAEAYVRYLGPARLDDLLEVRCWISEKRRASFRFDYEVRNEAKTLLASGFTRHACLDPATGRMVAIPEWLQSVMSVYNPDSAR